MNQYCRYCIHFCAGNGTFCEAKQKVIKESTAKSINRCKQFCLCIMDAFSETHRYKPRDIEKKQQTIDDCQIRLFDD
jgi:hypothetical protein